MLEELNRVKRKVTEVSLIVALLFSATAVAISVNLSNLATANPMAFLPYITIKSDGSIRTTNRIHKARWKRIYSNR